MNERRCDTCVFWDSSVFVKEDRDTGACRFLPPRADERSSIAVWPYTHDTDWCSSHQTKEEPVSF